MSASRPAISSGTSSGGGGTKDPEVLILLVVRRSAELVFRRFSPICHFPHRLGCAAPWRRPGGWRTCCPSIAIDGKWLRGIGDGQQVKLFAAMLHQEKVIIAQHAIPEDTNEITQVRELLDPVALAGAVVTGDAAHAQRQTASCIAGPAEDGGRESDYFLFVEHASHCSCCLSWRVKESSLAVSGLDTQAFAASLGEVDGVELAALDLVQHGLAGDAEVAGGLAEGQPAVWCLGPDAVAELLVDADLPGCSGGELLADTKPSRSHR